MSKTVTFSIRLSDQEHELLRRLAVRYHSELDQAARRIVADWLALHEPELVTAIAPSVLSEHKALTDRAAKVDSDRGI